MSSLTTSADTLISEVTAAVTFSLHGSIAPIIKKLTDAVAELAAAVGQAPAATAARRPGRPRKAAAVAAKPAPAPVRVRGKKNPRGTTRQAIAAALSGSKKAMTLTDIRNRLLEMPAFSGHNPKNLYTQIIATMQKMTEIQRMAGGLYSIKAGKGAK